MPRRRPYPPSYSRTIRAQIEHLRIRGYGGGVISAHRALMTLPLKPYKILGSILLVIAMLLAWWLLRGSISDAWRQIFEFWRRALGIEGYVVPGHYHLGDWIRFEVPLFRTGAAPFTRGLWLWGAIISLGIFLVALFLPRRLMPYAYLVRSAVFVQVISQFFFWFWPEAFPYSLSGYLEVMTLAGFFLLPLVPMLLGFVHYIFDFTLWQRVALTFLIVGHLFILIPLQLTAHAYLMHHFSVLLMPFLFLVFGLPMDVFVFIAFYSWGVSWPSLVTRANGGPRRVKLATASTGTAGIEKGSR